MKPIIGILATNCEGTQVEYIRAIEKAGGCPVVLSEVENISTINSINQILDGIVFTGGTDISPLNYEEISGYFKKNVLKVTAFSLSIYIKIPQAYSFCVSRLEG